MNNLGFEPLERSARGLAKSVGDAIRRGELAPGTRLPPIRAVARQLGLSPATVHSAWAMLARTGALRTAGRRGTTVADVYSGSVRYSRALDSRQQFERDLSTGTPDLALLPGLAAAIADQTSSALPGGYLDAPAVPELIAHLRATWPFAAQAFMVVDGAMDAIELVTRANVRLGDRVIVEDPCFPLLIDGLEAAGAEVVGVKMDDQGMLARPLREALARPAAAVVLQPRAHNPTGISLSRARAAELAQIIGVGPALIVEDDSAGHIASTPAISLGEWLPEQTIHVRSFSKSHGPDLRLAAIGGPADVLEEMTARRRLGQGWTSRLLQRILLNLLTDPDAIQTVARARQTYRQRRAAMVATLSEHGIRIGGADGVNIWVPVASETGALVRLASQGIGAAAGSPFTLSDNQGDHIRVTIGGVAEHHEKLAARVADAARARAPAAGR